MPVIGVLALQGDVREHVAALTACGARAVPVRRAAELDAVDAMVLPGGESTTMSRLLVTFELLAPLRARIAAGMPTYGSCAGMILLAREVLDGRPDQQQLGGLDVVVRRNAFGRQVDSFETDLRVDGLRGGPVRAVFIRAPWVEEVGAGRAGARHGAPPHGGGLGHRRGRGPGRRGAAGGGARDGVPPGAHRRPARARAVLRPGEGTAAAA